MRASLGDILAEEGRAVLFVKTELAPHFLSQIDKIGRVGVQITKGFTDPLPQAHSFQPMGGVVASERLDCLVAFLAGHPAGKKPRRWCTRVWFPSTIGRRIPFRTVIMKETSSPYAATGDLFVDMLGPVTKKGRLSVKCRKYI